MVTDMTAEQAEKYVRESWNEIRSFESASGPWHICDGTEELEMGRSDMLREENRNLGISPAEILAAKERLRDDALAVGMDSEYMRICSEIDELIRTRNAGSSYGRGQIYILEELRRRINWDGHEAPSPEGE